MASSATREEQIAACIHAAVSQAGFIRADVSSPPEGIWLAAMWKRKTWLTNRAIVLISIGHSEKHPGRYAQEIKGPIGRIVGYTPVFYALGLQIVFLGVEVLPKAIRLDKYLDRVDNCRVVLQSIHVVDMRADKLLENLEEPLVRMQLETETPALVRYLGLMGHDFLPPQGIFQAAKPTGRASLSVRTWGQSITGPLIDALEEGICAFLETQP